jgi:hypothetical protein
MTSDATRPTNRSPEPIGVPALAVLSTSFFPFDVGQMHIIVYIELIIQVASDLVTHGELQLNFTEHTNNNV